MALLIELSPKVDAPEEKVTIPMKSLLLKVFTTLLAASLTIYSLRSFIDPEISNKIMTFFLPEIAATYQGRYRGS